MATVHQKILARYEFCMRNLAAAKTITDVDIHHAEAATCINLMCELDFPQDVGNDAPGFHDYGIVPVSMRTALTSLTRRVTDDLHEAGLNRINLDASSPAALSTSLARLREWMREHEVAHVTIMPQDVASMGVDADTASQRMWDAAERVITEVRFEARMVWKDASHKGGEWRLFDLGEDREGGSGDDDVFHYGGDRFATADDFIRAHGKDNSPEEWYIDSPAPMAPRGWDVAETDHD
jgi:hypothetical protein